MNLTFSVDSPCCDVKLATYLGDLTMTVEFAGGAVPDPGDADDVYIPACCNGTYVFDLSNSNPGLTDTRPFNQCFVDTHGGALGDKICMVEGSITEDCDYDYYRLGVLNSSGTGTVSVEGYLFFDIQTDHLWVAVRHVLSISAGESVLGFKDLGIITDVLTGSPSYTVNLVDTCPSFSGTTVGIGCYADGGGTANVSFAAA